MKGTDQFKQTIQNYLEKRAGEDLLFLETYTKPNKNIDDCVKYILGQVKESGSNGFADDEIYNMAVHYYDENDIKVGDFSGNMNVVVNHHVELTEEEKAEMHQKAKERAENEAYEAMKPKKKTFTPSPTTKTDDKKTASVQQSLF